MLRAERPAESKDFIQSSGGDAGGGCAIGQPNSSITIAWCLNVLSTPSRVMINLSAIRRSPCEMEMEN